MAQWLRQAFEGHEMLVIQMKVIDSNPDWVQLKARHPSKLDFNHS